MANHVGGDQLAIIRIEGMHCHKCEARVSEALGKVAGVHEVEVDFPSRQASVLFDPKRARPAAMLEAIRAAGYQVGEFMTNADSAQTPQWTHGH